MSSIKSKIWADAYLRKVIEAHKLAHAYMFLGPDQQKKIWTAVCMAKAVLCSQPGAQFCDSCSTCKRVDNHNHPDVLWIRPAGPMRQIKIDTAHSLQASLSLKSFEGGMKLAFIIEADRMNTEAANAMLKTIEEPSKNTILVLMSADRENFLPTIISRCQQIYFPLSEKNDLLEYLVQERAVDKNTAEVVCSLSRGNFTYANRYLNDEHRQWRDFIVDSVFKLLDRRLDIFLFAEQIESKINERIKVVLKTHAYSQEEMGLPPHREDATNAVERKSLEKSILHEQVCEFFQYVQMCCRDILLYMRTNDSKFIVNIDKLSIIKKISSELDKDRFEKIFNEIEDAYHAYTGNTKLQFVLEIMFDRILSKVEAAV